jgi:hypothetical protein
MLSCHLKHGKKFLQPSHLMHLEHVRTVRLVRLERLSGLLQDIGNSSKYAKNPTGS